MSVISSRTRALLALSALKGVGPAALKKAATLANFWELSFDEWCKALPQVAKSMGGPFSPAVWREANDWANEQVALAERHDARIISPFDDEYPKLLAATKDDPFLLFVKGRFAENQGQSVAIIGTREPTQHGQLIARRITQFFVEQHWSVVSGLAMGCDAIAHQAAIEARGHTVAVLAHGLQMIAPSRHQQLAQSILDAGGALVSEYPFGRNVMSAQFVKRDRTQAGMSLGVVMIQSDIKGGSLYASRAALDYKRWLAVPYPTDRDLERGESKIQANLVIAEGTDAERAELLRCPISSLGLVRIVRGREDYLQLIAADEDNASGVGHLLMESAVRGERVPAPRETMVEETPAATESHSRVSPERERDAQGRNLQQSNILSKTEAGASCHVLGTYYLEVSPEDVAYLRITQAPVEGDNDDLHMRSYNYDAEVIFSLSRLGHLQSKLDELRKVLTSKRQSDSWQISRSQFQIEDVLTHMKRATDELVHLDNGLHGQGLRSVIVRHGAVSGQPELPLSGPVMHDIVEPPLIDVLGCLVDALPRSVNVHRCEGGNDPPEKGLCIKVHLGDLVLSFNELVKLALLARVAAHLPR